MTCMNYIGGYGFGQIVRWLPHDEQPYAVYAFLMAGHCYIKRTDKPHVLPIYRICKLTGKKLEEWVM